MQPAEPAGPLLLLTCATRSLINWLQRDEREAGPEEVPFCDGLGEFCFCAGIRRSHPGPEEPALVNYSACRQGP